MFLLVSAVLAVLGRVGLRLPVPFPAEPGCFFSKMETNHCNARILSGWHRLIRTVSAGSTSLVPACFCSCP